ncbi:LysR family transcriptional regulator [Pseudooceanicola sp. CBS1P-1]|uniref:LysR family transcriptional regulator n=1 Tax=Pseudooceanicola albus TaxID=2692189 RepID=A0A6L7GD57_9RHOB|nr:MULTISPECIES: LysR family transcriptional regulator [Pseudooceanicola]MBT9386597.1 LysR family transcriptional regulator [Pseudooceanicola endophyticus]MXN20713.1 LysR family transcriptional regulator [Pseudooceanicola albus]
MIERQHLAILLAVSRTGSVTAAAKQLNLTQSALSHAMSKLEGRFGLQLWLRKGRNLHLTQAGEYLLEIAERFVPEIEHAERVLRQFASGRKGTLRIAMACHPCHKFMMRLTRPYLAAWPEVDFNIRSGFRFDGITALESREIDVLITPDPEENAALSFHPVFDYELRLVVPEDHPLAEVPFVQPRDILEETLITLPVATELLDFYTHFLIPAQCRPRARTLIETTELMLHLVAAQRGVSVIPDWLIQEEGCDLPVRSLRIGPNGLMKQLNFGIRKQDGGLDYIQGLIEIALSVNRRQGAT